MSYIHDALNKAQREKDLLAGKYAKIWSAYRRGHSALRREWVVSGGMIVIAIAFSAYSWLHSLPELSSDLKAGPSVHRSTVTPPPDHVNSGKASKSSLDKRVSKSKKAKVKAKPTNRASPSVKEGKKQPKKIPPARPGKSEPDNGTALYSRALALQKQGRLPEARKLYETALERSPRLVSALNNLGAVYIQEKNYAAARRVLEKAIRIDSDYVDPYYNLGCLHALQKDVGRSLFYLKKAISLSEAVRKWAKTDKDLQNLHGHSEYEKIIQGAQDS